MLPAGDITDYGVGLFVHILAAVAAFGPTFGYGILFSILPKYPKSAPALIEGVRRIDRFLVNPAMIVLLLAGIYLLAEGHWDSSETFITVGFVAIVVLFGMQGMFFAPQGRKLQEVAERDLEAGDTLSPEFEALSRRMGQVGALAGLIVVVTIFFMVTKP